MAINTTTSGKLQYTKGTTVGAIKLTLANTAIIYSDFDGMIAPLPFSLQPTVPYVSYMSFEMRYMPTVPVPLTAFCGC